MPGQVDEDVDTELPHQGSHVAVAPRADIMELVDGMLDAPANRAAVVRPEGHSNDVETRAVVPFEQARDQVCDRMPAKIARDVCEPDSLGLTAPSSRRQPLPDGNFVGDKPS